MFYKERSNYWSVSIVLGVWLAGIFASSIFTRVYLHDNNTLLLVALVPAVVWPLIFFLVSRCHFIPKLPNKGRLIAIVGFTIFSLLSVYVSPVMWESAAYLCMTLIVFLLALQFNSNLDARQYERGLKLYAFLTAILLIGFTWYDYQPGLRLGFGKEILNPNAIAVVAVSVTLAATAIRIAIARYAIMASAVVIIVLTGSRASALSTIAGLLIIYLVRMSPLKTGRKLAIASAITIGAFIGAYYLDVVLPYAEEFFAIYDPGRGIVSGASGRMVGWHIAWELFLDNPIIGVGFRAHEQVLQIGVHNGYLAMLADIGLPGFVCIAYLVLAGVVSLWRKRKCLYFTRTCSVLTGLCFGYLLLAIFERVLINIGNPASLLFLLSVLHPAHTYKRVMPLTPGKFTKHYIVRRRGVPKDFG